MLKSSATQIAYSARPGTTPEAEFAALTACYRYILDRRAKKVAAEHIPEPDGPDDVRKDQDAHSATSKYS